MESGVDGRQRWVGTVIAVQANFYRVKLESLVEPESEPNIEACLSQSRLDRGAWSDRPDLLCTRRALLKKIGQSVMVGDRVLLEDPDWLGERGAICEVLPRQTELSRPPIANADQILLVFSLAQPELDPFQLTKFLLTAEQTQMRLVLALSKTDLVDEATQTQWCDRLQGWGYQAIPISLISGQGLEQLNTALANQLTILSGPSGVGKSSLINYLIPDIHLRVGAVSERWHQGRHTTRHVELFPLAGTGLLADSPGFNQPNLELEPQVLASLFPEVRAILNSESCQFSDCLHHNEPNCALPEEWDRREFYLNLLQEMQEKYELNLQRAKNEVQQKSKSGSSGQVTYEPRLAQKKYRRQSRRRQHQRLEDYYSEELR